MAAVDAPTLKAIKIKTGVLKRIAKEKTMYEKEAEQQQARVEKMKTDGKDEYDIRKQQEVLEESRMMIPDCLRRGAAAWDDLSKLVETETHLSEAEEYKAAKEMLEETKVMANRD